MTKVPWRLATAIALVLSIIGVAAPITVEAQSGTATLTIHSRFCPPGFDGTDIYETCHDNIGMRGVQYTVMSAYVKFGFGDIPDENGEIVLNGLSPSEYTLSSSIGLELGSPRVY